jgi:hypothetical protein
MKKISSLLAFFLLFAASVALASTAIVTSVAGTVQAQTGDGPSRALRLGDELRQGDTVVTGRASSVVMKFDDGQVAALTAYSRMTITRYQYEPASGAGNVLLSLVNGGMRAITGLIGRRTPENVAYRAATATIGIRGTDVTIVTDGGNVVVTVAEGAVYFTFAGRTITIEAGQGVNARTDGTFQLGAAEQIIGQISASLAAAVGGLEGLRNAIAEAAASGPGGTGPGLGTPSSPTSGPVGGGDGGVTASGS